MEKQFRKKEPRKKEPVRNVVLSDEAKRAYEELIRQKDEHARKYASHLAPPEYRGK
jgi:hypothetical protein